MKVVILGAGQVGASIARYLAFEENDVSVVDYNPEVLKKISDSMDIKPVLGFASHPDVLEQAGTKDADLILAVTASDEVNIVACEVANSIFNVRTKVARIRSQHYLAPLWSHLFSPHHIAIDHIISPELEVARSIEKSIQVTGAFHVISLCGEMMRSVGMKCLEKAPILHTPLHRIPALFPHLGLGILCIIRHGKVFIPDGDDQLLPGDEIHILTRTDQTQEIAQAFGYGERESRRIIILGGGNIGLSLAKSLEVESLGMTAKLIERSPKRAELAARELKHTEILCGDGLDNDVLSEANVSTCEAVISITDDDKVNILSSLLGKNMGARRAMALLNNMNQSDFATSLGIDSVINPRSITVSSILQHIRQGRLHSIHSIRDDFAELIEAEVRESSTVVGLSVGDIVIQGEILVGALIREDEIIFMPQKSTFIRIEDKLILMATKNAIKKVEKLFAPRGAYTS